MGTSTIEYVMLTIASAASLAFTLLVAGVFLKTAVIEPERARRRREAIRLARWQETVTTHSDRFEVTIQKVAKWDRGHEVVGEPMLVGTIWTDSEDPHEELRLLWTKAQHTAYLLNTGPLS